MKPMHLPAAALIAALTLPALAQQADNPQPVKEEAVVEIEQPAAANPQARPGPVVVARRIVLKDENGPMVFEGEDGNRVRLQRLPQAAGGADLLVHAAELPMVQATYLGVNCDPLDFDTAKLLGVPRGTGLTIAYVAEDSPAAEAGLKQGDVLTKLGDQLLINAEQLAVLVRTHQDGDAVTLHVIREGEPLELNATLATKELPDLAPGGMNLNRQWRVQRNDQPNLLPIDPFRQHNDPARVLELIERGAAPIQLPPGGGDNPIDQEMRQMVEQLQLQMRQQRQEMDRMFEQMRMRLDLDIQDMRDNLIELEGDPGLAEQVRSQVSWNDGQHRIDLTTDGEGRRLTIKTQAGEVLYDDALPADDWRKAIDHLPIDVQRKVNELLNGELFQIEVPQPRPAAPEIAPGDA